VTDPTAEAINTAFAEIIDHAIEGMEHMLQSQLLQQIHDLLEEKDVDPKVIREVMAGLDNDRLDESYRIIALVVSALPSNRRSFEIDDRRRQQRGGRRATDFDPRELKSSDLRSVIVYARATVTGERRQCAIVREFMDTP
jgi:hypothetical protein